MGRRSNRGNAVLSGVQQTPAPPPPATEYFYDDGFLRGARLYQTNNGQPVFFNQSFSTPDEQAIETQANQYIRGLVTQAGQAFQLTPEAIAQNRQAYLTPQLDALNSAYQDARGVAFNSANTGGTLDSVGFNRYLAGELERNRAKDLANLEANATLNQYDLPRRQLAPFQEAFNLYNAASQGQQTANLNYFNPVLQGNQLSNNTLQDSYRNLLSRQELMLRSLQYTPPFYQQQY